MVFFRLSKYKSVVKSVVCVFLVMFIALLPVGSVSFAEKGGKYLKYFEKIKRKWERNKVFEDKQFGGEVEIKVTYYSAEYIEAAVEAEAEKYLWTRSELEEYKYKLLKSLEYEKYIPFKIYIRNTGPSMHMAPFGKRLTLWVGKKKLKPADYDPRFNFKLLGEREGFVFFPRYDEKTGKPYLKGVKTIKLSIDGSISPIISATAINFLWDITKDRPEKLTGTAMLRLELDRLIRRMEKLNEQRDKLLKELKSIEEEINKIERRINQIEQQIK